MCISLRLTLTIESSNTSILGSPAPVFFSSTGTWREKTTSLANHTALCWCLSKVARLLKFADQRKTMCQQMVVQKLHDDVGWCWIMLDVIVKESSWWQALPPPLVMGHLSGLFSKSLWGDDRATKGPGVGMALPTLSTQKSIRLSPRLVAGQTKNLRVPQRSPVQYVCSFAVCLQLLMLRLST